MSEDGESNSSSHKNLNFQIKPYAKRVSFFLSFNIKKTVDHSNIEN